MTTAIRLLSLLAFCVLVLPTLAADDPFPAVAGAEAMGTSAEPSPDVVDFPVVARDQTRPAANRPAGKVTTLDDPPCVVGHRCRRSDTDPYSGTCYRSYVNSDGCYYDRTYPSLCGTCWPDAYPTGGPSGGTKGGSGTSCVISWTDWCPAECSSCTRV
jgi:hypothetical protein